MQSAHRLASQEASGYSSVPDCPAEDTGTSCRAMAGDAGENAIRPLCLPILVRALMAAPFFEAAALPWQRIRRRWKSASAKSASVRRCVDQETHALASVLFLLTREYNAL